MYLFSVLLGKKIRDTTKKEGLSEKWYKFSRVIKTKIINWKDIVCSMCLKGYEWNFFKVDERYKSLGSGSTMILWQDKSRNSIFRHFIGKLQNTEGKASREKRQISYKKISRLTTDFSTAITESRK